MGIHNLTRVEDFWSSDDRLRVEGVAKIMPIQRWRKLNQYIHLTNNRDQPDPTDPNHDRLFKVRPLVDMCNRNFTSDIYRPSRNLSVDEAMIGFKGGSLLKQYIPNKPTKWGLKSWMLADSHTGFCVQADIYTGAKGGQGSTEGLGYKVVMGMARHVQGKHHHLFFDNYFTSPKLLIDLVPMQIYSTGTVRPNRKGLPLNFSDKDKKADRGKSAFWQKGDIVAVKWKDNNFVHLISTSCDDTMRQASRRVGGQLVNIPCPDMVKTYNKYMGGVDLNDQLRSYHPVGRKAKKYWKYILWFYVDLCLINSWILYKLAVTDKPKKTYSQQDFRLDVCDGLVAGFTSRKRRLSQVRVLSAIVNQENVGGHVLVKFQGRKRVCVMCSRKKRKTDSGRPVESTFGCQQCSVNLCKDGCHAEFHAISE
ncbi:piggyBac transposable element-derived protein 4-like [Mercenaria mercenaria]|uniref:piggyBac transposable element-derived protein 4-like n=1 Tax=Mercenaria mercenaria TaxID=6596 RepID=UPI00234ED417|nr:piggyBac transposable element-derived protein 4-like [Mercenaria mercenaria]